MSVNTLVDISCFKFQFFLDDEVQKLQSKRRYSETIGTGDDFKFKSKEFVLEHKNTSIEKLKKNQEGFQISNCYPKFYNYRPFDSINELFDHSLEEVNEYSLSDQVAQEIQVRFENSLQSKLNQLLNNSTFNQLTLYNLQNERKQKNLLQRDLLNTKEERQRIIDQFMKSLTNENKILTNQTYTKQTFYLIKELRS